MSEIDDAELSRLRGAEKLLGQLMANKKTKRTQQKLIKEVYPDYVTIEDEAEPYIERLDKIEKLMETRFKKEDDDRLEAKFQGDLNRYRLSADNPDGYTDEGIEKIKALMKERTIPDVDAAVALFERQNPQKPETPSHFSPTGWGFGHETKDEDRKLLFKDEDAWAEQEAVRAWNDAAKDNQIRS